MAISNLFIVRQKDYYGQRLANQFTDALKALDVAERKIKGANGIDRITSDRLLPVVEEMEKGVLGSLMNTFPTMTMSGLRLEARTSWKALVSIGHMNGQQLSGKEGLVRRGAFERAFKSLQADLPIIQGAVLERTADINRVAPAAPFATAAKATVIGGVAAAGTVGGLAVYDATTGSDTLKPVRETSSVIMDRLGSIAAS